MEQLTWKEFKEKVEIFLETEKLDNIKIAWINISGFGDISFGRQNDGSLVID